jgi:hypothetical protein
MLEGTPASIPTVLKRRLKPCIGATLGSLMTVRTISLSRRGWGKPTQAVDANLSFFDGLTDHERQALLAALEALQVDDRSVSNT